MEKQHLPVILPGCRLCFLEKPVAEIAAVEITSVQEGYPASNITDHDDFSWWIAGADAFPQVITLTLKEPSDLIAGRIRFQKEI